MHDRFPRKQETYVQAQAPLITSGTLGNGRAWEGPGASSDKKKACTQAGLMLLALNSMLLFQLRALQTGGIFPSEWCLAQSRHFAI